jgi:hypothetical protein
MDPVWQQLRDALRELFAAGVDIDLLHAAWNPRDRAYVLRKVTAQVRRSKAIKRRARWVRDPFAEAYWMAFYRGLVEAFRASVREPLGLERDALPPVG